MVKSKVISAAEIQFKRRLFQAIVNIFAESLKKMIYEDEEAMKINADYKNPITGKHMYFEILAIEKGIQNEKPPDSINSASGDNVTKHD